MNKVLVTVVVKSKVVGPLHTLVTYASHTVLV